MRLSWANIICDFALWYQQNNLKHIHKRVFLLFYTFSEEHLHVLPHIVIQTVCITVKSADSGIQNSADGSREMLATTPSNNLPDAGKTYLGFQIPAFEGVSASERYNGTLERDMRMQDEDHRCSWCSLVEYHTLNSEI